jgi:hypothetical protein
MLRAIIRSVSSFGNRRSNVAGGGDQKDSLRAKTSPRGEQILGLDAIPLAVHRQLSRKARRCPSRKALRPATRWNLALFPIFVILRGIVSGLLLSPLGNALSRHFEKQADLYALENSKEKKAFMTALAGLADRNLSNAYPEWWIKILYYSHPPIGERLRTEELFGSGPSDIPQ